jgi:hypothetical protein
MSTAFVTLCDASYFPRARRTIDELRSHGKWSGDIVLIAVDFTPPPMPDVLVWVVTHIDTDGLVADLRAYPIKPQADNRHFGKLTQWDKLYVFHDCFRRWKRIVFLDAGLRVTGPVDPLLALPWKGRFLAPNDAGPYDDGKRFGCQVDLNGKPSAVLRFLAEYPNCLTRAYFLNCMFVYDTDLLDSCSMSEMVEMMNAFPICMCNEMGILNMVFALKLNVWDPFPVRVGDRYLFGWNESDFRDNPSWTEFHFLKYSSSMV